MGKTYVKNKDLGLHRLPGPFAFFFQSFQKRKIAGKSSSNAMVRAKKMWLNLPPEKKALWLAVAKDAVKARRAEREVLLGVKEPVAGQAAERDEPVCEGAEAMPIDISFLAFTFRAINKIGEGAYGKVYKVVSRGSLREPMAAKVGIDLTHEMEIMQRVSHPSVMSAFGIGSTLEQLPGSVEAWAILNQVLLGLMHMYLKEIVHADVKPQNIVIFQWGCKAMNARLSDFSLSRSTKNHQVRLEEGTTVYSCLHRPVEVWLNYRKEAGNYSKHLEFKRCKSVQLDSGGFRASGWGWEATGRLGDYSGSLAIRIPAQMVLNGNADLSAFGATAFELLSGRFLFPHNEEKMLSLVQAQGPPVKVFNMYDESVASAVKRPRPPAFVHDSDSQ
ncbi:MKK5, partial [Symbiodinium microadriaticum]